MSPQAAAPRRTASADTPADTPAENGTDTGTTDTSAADKAAADAEKKATLDNLRTLASDDSAGGRQIKRAVMLEGERTDVGSRITKNREYLRLMEDNEELTDEQKALMAVYYPLKEKDERRSKDEVESTRKLKEAARVLAVEFSKAEAASGDTPAA